MREFELIAWLRQRLVAKRADTRLGIRDDAAIIAPRSGCELVVTTDTLISGRHFPEDTRPADIGYKSVVVNLSDLAAMGADPAWLTFSLAAPSLDNGWCDALIDGVMDAIGGQPIDVIGGDTTASDVLTLSVTAIGQVPAGKALRRSGARPGDLIAVTGTLGDAAAGLALWSQRASADENTQFLIDRLRRPTARRGAALRDRAHAAIDISDGLLADLGHICNASGVGARVDIDRLPCSDALAAYAPGFRPTRRRLQATGGDDYELCLTLDPDDRAETAAALGCPLTAIGEIEATPGLRLVDDADRPIKVDSLGAAGWDHFAID